MRSMEILHAYVAQWLAFLSMLMMLYYSLDRAQAYKDFWTSYMSFELLLALKSI
jgi:hypothetical protein